MERIALSLRRPFHDKDWLKKLAIGGVVGFVPIFPLGYFLEWINSSYRESKEPELSSLPEWKEWGKLTANGLMVLLIILVYSLAPLILLGIGETLTSLDGVSIVLGRLFRFLSSLGMGVVSFILPAVLVQFALKGKIEAAYDIKTIGEKIGNVFAEYLISYLLSLGLVFLVWIIIFILKHILPVVFFIPVLNFYIGLVILYRFSRLLGETET